jgi:hypothetical protein
MKKGRMVAPPFFLQPESWRMFTFYSIGPRSIPASADDKNLHFISFNSLYPDARFQGARGNLFEFFCPKNSCSMGVRNKRQDMGQNMSDFLTMYKCRCPTCHLAIINTKFSTVFLLLSKTRTMYKCTNAGVQLVIWPL